MNDSTRERLLETGRKLFSSNGFRGAAVREITREANANLGAVTYHFGSKAGLYRAVLDRVFRTLAERIEAAAAEPAPPEGRLRRIVSTLFAFFADVPDAPQLFLRELASGGALPEPVVPYLRRNLAAISGVIRDGQEQGAFRTMAPQLVAFSLVAQTVWFAVMGRHLHIVTGDTTPPEQLALAMERHIADLLVAALQPSEDQP